MTGTLPAATRGATSTAISGWFLELGSSAHVGRCPLPALAEIHRQDGMPTRKNAARHNLAGEYFSERRDVVRGPRRQFAHGGYAAQQFLQSFEISSEVTVKLCEKGRFPTILRGVVVALLQRAAEL